MTDASWGDLSQQAIAAAGVVYFLALVAHLVEWSSVVGRRQAKVAVRPSVPRRRPSGRPDARCPTSTSTGSRCSAGSACC